MRLNQQQKTAGRATFLNDILKLEVSGLKQKHFFVINILSIFRKTTEELITKANQKMVEAMVWHYMKNPRFVMLTVIFSNVSIVTQKILFMTEEVNINEHWTLDVLTKLNLVNKSVKSAVIELIEEKRHKLNLGWCLVCNSGQMQLNDSNTDKDAVKKTFFQTVTPWKSLDKDRMSMRALRVCLQETLIIYIHCEFLKVGNTLHIAVLD